ncbi:uncharacterized protein ACBT44_012002 [Syngnathus typhle]
MLDKFVFVYLDDILIFSRSLPEHIKHVRTVLRRLLENSLYVKAEKCEFHASSSRGARLTPSAPCSDRGGAVVVSNTWWIGRAMTTSTAPGSRAAGSSTVRSSRSSIAVTRTNRAPGADGRGRLRGPGVRARDGLVRRCRSLLPPRPSILRPTRNRTFGRSTNGVPVLLVVRGVLWSFLCFSALEPSLVGGVLSRTAAMGVAPVTGPRPLISGISATCHSLRDSAISTPPAQTRVSVCRMILLRSPVHDKLASMKNRRYRRTACSSQPDRRSSASSSYSHLTPPARNKISIATHLAVLSKPLQSEVIKIVDGKQISSKLNDLSLIEKDKQ